MEASACTSFRDAERLDLLCWTQGPKVGWDQLASSAGAMIRNSNGKLLLLKELVGRRGEAPLVSTLLFVMCGGAQRLRSPLRGWIRTETEISNLRIGCHGLGVCDKAVSSKNLENERNLIESAKRSVVKQARIQIQHDLVADSKIVAPLFTFRFENSQRARNSIDSESKKCG